MPLREGYLNGEPCWADVSVDDLDGAKEFYAGVFGWAWEDQFAPDGGFMYSMASKDGHYVAGLGPIPPDLLKMGLRSVWNTYLATDSVDEVYAKAIEAGGKGLVAPMDVMATGRMAYIADDQGVAVGLWQAGVHTGAQLIKEPGAISWSELYVPDVDRAVEFLGTVLGMEAEPTDMGPMSYTLLKVAGQPVAGVMVPPQDVPPCWSVYFKTDDVEATADRVTSLGGSVLQGPFPTPLGDMIVAQDRSGGVFLAHADPTDCGE